LRALGVTPIVERIIRNRYLVPSKTEIYPNFESLIYQDVILLQTPRQVIERDPAMCRILSMIAARFSYGNRLFYLDHGSEPEFVSYGLGRLWKS
jgi:hypothetical protein